MKNLLVLLAMLLVGAGCSGTPWTLSLYDAGKTVQRLNHGTKEECFEAGSTLSKNEDLDRFDCGYSCKGDMDNLERAIACDEVCDVTGCRK